MMVDTGAWYAICDRSDKHHRRAREFYEQVAGTVPLVTTDLILAETWTLLAARLGRDAAVTFWQTIREADIAVATLEQPDIEAAWHILNAFPDQSFSFTDCTTFAAMERLRIDRVFTFDQHFAIYRYGPGRQKAFLCYP
jgi:predicted nucleic acid-binding protein